MITSINNEITSVVRNRKIVELIDIKMKLLVSSGTRTMLTMSKTLGKSTKIISKRLRITIALLPHDHVQYSVALRWVCFGT